MSSERIQVRSNVVPLRPTTTAQQPCGGGQATSMQIGRGHESTDGMRAWSERVRREVGVTAYITELSIIQLHDLKQLFANDASEEDIDRVFITLSQLFGVLNLVITNTQVRLPTLCLHADHGWSVVTRMAAIPPATDANSKR